MIGIVVLAAVDLVVLALPGIPGGVRLAGHVVLTLAGYGLAARRGPIGIGTGLFGLVGPIGLLAARRVGSRRATALPEPEAAAPDAVRSDAASIGARLLDGRHHVAPAGSLGSLVTVLRHGSVDARRRALETVVRSFEPALSPLIAKALADGDQTIRALAAAAAARVTRNLAHQRIALAARIDGGDRAAEDALIALLAGHAHGNLLLSRAQRDALRQDVLAMLRDRPAHTAHGATFERTLAEAAWSVGDYDLIDDLARRGAGEGALGWWRAA